MSAFAHVSLAQLVLDGVAPVDPETVDLPLRRADKDKYHHSFWVEERAVDGYLAFCRLEFDIDGTTPLYWEFASWENRVRDCHIFLELCEPEAPVSPFGSTRILQRRDINVSDYVPTLLQLDLSACQPETLKVIPLLFQRTSA